MRNCPAGNPDVIKELKQGTRGIYLRWENWWHEKGA